MYNLLAVKIIHRKNFFILLMHIEQNKQIVISADKSPTDLDGLEIKI